MDTLWLALGLVFERDMQASEKHDNVQVLVYNCTKSMILTIQDMRDKGDSYRVIAKKIGYHHHAIARYHRLYEKFGIEVFANDK